MKKLSDLIRQTYTLTTLNEIIYFLEDKGIFDFPVLNNGLFPAAHYSSTDNERNYLNYDFVWLRDNIHIAHTHYILGKYDIVKKNINTLISFYIKYLWRFEKIINNKLSYNTPNNRPHIRFYGETLEECPVKWAHAQNDAFGAFIWLLCKLIDEDILVVTQDIKCILLVTVKYLIIIKYWEDEDSGYWEETRKINASSIGTVIAGLQMMNKIYPKLNGKFGKLSVDSSEINYALRKGKIALKKILPYESIQNGKERKVDAALIFLIYPYNVVSDIISKMILKNVKNSLEGKYGIRRYLGDSFWCSNYKCKLSPEDRTKNFSDHLAERDTLFESGTEAQWCIFDSIISTIYGHEYLKTKEKFFLEKQIYYLNRSLYQITSENCPLGAYKCPEAYYLSNGLWIPNDATPLLWSQANLCIALTCMKTVLVKNLSFDIL
ncbi:MAG: glycoside hydrolase family 15 protein [Clostridia bacterium]|nr:glycoside hydrolase family 15 protein [Clostridia bacterium]